MNPSKKDRQTTGTTMVQRRKSETVAILRPFEVLARRRWQLMGCLLLVCGIAFAATALRKPMYESVSRVLIESPRMSPAAALFGGSGQGDISTQVELLHSRQVLGRTVEKLNGTDISPVSMDQQIEVLRENVKVKPVRGSQLIDIVGISNTGTQAATIANHMASSFVEISMENHLKNDEHIKAQMDWQVNNYNQEIEDLGGQVDAFRREHKITGSNSDLAAVIGRIGQLEGRLTQAQFVRMELQAKQERLIQMMAKGQGIVAGQSSMPEINNDHTVRSMQQTIESLEQKQMQLEQAYLPGHQKLRDVRVQIGDLKQRVGNHKQVLVQAMQEQIASGIIATVKEEEKFRLMLDEQKDLGVTLTGQQMEYQQMLGELEMARRLRTECIGKIRQFTLEDKMNETPVKIVDMALAPLQMAGLSKSHRAASILLLGLLFSLGFIFAVDRLATASQEEEQMMHMPMGMPHYGYAPAGYWPMAGAYQGYGAAGAVASGSEVQAAEESTETCEAAAPNGNLTPEIMGQVGLMKLGSNNIEDAAFAARCHIVQTDQSSSAAGSFRQVVSNLLSRFGETRQNLVITGARTKSGKTTCASNLAILLAQSGRKVLLVDANPESPDLKRVFPEVNNKPGVQDILEDMSQIDLAMQQTDINNLYVLGFGGEEGRHENWDEPKIWVMTNGLRMRYDWVIFDGSTLEDRWTQALLQAVGKSLCVISSETNEEDEKATEVIEQYGAVTVGLIENYQVQKAAVSQEN
ncbi:MAG: hypothetical protein GY869_28350 [Planctomycetes bacterium]|nr:hypothetical protein [Planctomycetota bacterium]